MASCSARSAADLRTIATAVLIIRASMFQMTGSQCAAHSAADVISPNGIEMRAITALAPG